MPSTPLHHGIRLMPDDLFLFAKYTVPAPVIRTRDDILALGDRFYALEQDLAIPSLRLLADPSLTSAELGRLLSCVMQEVHRFHKPGRESLVPGRPLRRLNEAMLLMAKAIRERRLVPSPEGRELFRHAFKPRLGRVTREYTGALAALAQAAGDQDWGVDTELLRDANDAWTRHLPTFREELTKQREDAEAGRVNAALNTLPTDPRWAAAFAERAAALAARAGTEIPLLALATPFDALPITAAPVELEDDLPWVVPPHLRTIEAWRDRDLRYGQITDGMLMLARNPDALDEMLDAIEVLHPGKAIRARVELGGAPLAPTSLVWERLVNQLTNAQRAKPTRLALVEFEEALATDPAGIPAAVYHAALTASRRYISLDFPSEALFSFPLTAGTVTLWWEMFFQTIDRAGASDVSARVEAGRLAQYIQRLAHPELADVLQTPPPAVLAASTAAQGAGFGLDLRLGFALAAAPMARATPAIAARATSR